MIPKRNITRKALNEPAFLGSLYNTVIETLYAFSCIFLLSFMSSGLASFRESNKTNFTCFFEDDFEDVLTKLGYEKELIDSSLLKMVQLDDIAKSLKEKGKYRNNTLRFFLRIVFEKGFESLDISEKITENQINLKNDLTSDATHFVSGIKWGVEALVTFEYENEDNRDETELRELFNEVINELLYDKIFKESEFKRNFKEKLKFSIQSNTYFGTDEYKRLEDVKKLVQDLPFIAKIINNGKGVQLEYTLSPLNDDFKINNFDSKRIRNCMSLVKKVRTGIDKNCDELIETFEDNDRLYDAKDEMETEEIKAREELCQLLIDARLGLKDSNEIHNECSLIEARIMKKKDDLNHELHISKKKNEVHNERRLSFSYQLPESGKDFLFLMNFYNLS